VQGSVQASSDLSQGFDGRFRGVGYCEFGTHKTCERNTTKPICFEVPRIMSTR
jgi:hypothetical protein